MDAPKLNPCPFCGNEDVSLVKYHGITTEFWAVECMRFACPRIAVEGFETKEEAIENWNGLLRLRMVKRNGLQARNG